MQYIVKLKYLPYYINIFKKRLDEFHIDLSIIAKFITQLYIIKQKINNDNYYINISSLITHLDFDSYLFIRHIFLDINCYIKYNNIQQYKQIIGILNDINIDTYILFSSITYDQYYNYLQLIIKYCLLTISLDYFKLYKLVQYILLDLKYYQLLITDKVYLYDIIETYLQQSEYISTYKFLQQNPNLYYYYKIIQLFNLNRIITIIQTKYRYFISKKKKIKKYNYENVLKDIEYLPETTKFCGGIIYNQYKLKFYKNVKELSIL